MRVSRESIHMATASLWSLRATCSLHNRNIGCVITTDDMRRILSIGYNGPARTLPDNYCLTWRTSHLVPLQMIGSRCPCLHAEANAIAYVDSTIPNKTLFVTMQPCEQCSQMILQSNITRVCYWQDYRDVTGVELLRRGGVVVDRIEPYGLTTTPTHPFRIQKET